MRFPLIVDSPDSSNWFIAQLSRALLVRLYGAQSRANQSGSRSEARTP